MNLQKIKLLAKEGCFHVGNDESYFILKMIDVIEAAKACREFSKLPTLSPMRMLEGEALLARLQDALEALEKE